MRVASLEMVRFLVLVAALFASSIQAVADEKLRTQSVIGRVVATQSGGIASPIAAVVADVSVIAGDEVKAGTVMARLNVDDRKADLRSALAQVKVTEARRSVAQAALDAEQATYERLNRLRDSAAFNASRFEDSAKESLRLRAQIAVEQAMIEQAKAAAARILVDTERARIIAPYDGIVMTREIDRGDFVTVGRRMFRLVNISQLEVEIDAPSAAAAALRPGLRLTGTAPNGQSVTVEVRTVLPIENALTRTRTVRLRVLDSGAALAVGQSLDVELPLSGGNG